MMEFTNRYYVIKFLQACKTFLAQIINDLRLKSKVTTQLLANNCVTKNKKKYQSSQFY